MIITLFVNKDNKKAIRTWLNPKGYGISRVSWLSMRLSGVFLLVFFIIHVIHSASILDRLSWGQLLYTAYSPIGFVILSVMIGLGTFHAINGVRLMFNQGGIGIGSPKRPDYPYTVESMNRKNRLCIYMTIGVAALALYYSLGVLFKF
jgi:succinate dehydrogenase / fumarate reductase cytochrome b subunit